MKDNRYLLERSNLSRIGSIRQLAGIEPIVLQEGKAAGVKAFDVRNGRLRFHVLADRGMDIGQVECEGVPFAWISPVGYAASAYYEPDGNGWLRNFAGGLLTTCGLTQTGEACQDGEEKLGLHGRISNLPATQVSHRERWDGDVYRLSVSGVVTQSSLYGEYVELQRAITTEYGSNEILVEDTVTNCGHSASPFMFMYHINLGFPLVDEGAVIVANCTSIRAWEGTPTADLPAYHEVPPPSDTVDEEVLHLDINPSADGNGYVMLANRERGIGFYLKYNTVQFPAFSLWKGIRKGVYCIGFEPANCGLNGRVRERSGRGVASLQPQESSLFSTRFGFLTTAKEIDSMADRIAANR